MTNQGQDIQHPKLRGEWAELRFMARAAEHGLRVTKPWGDCARYDFAVEHDGKFLCVQVKSTKAKQYNSYVCNLRTTHNVPYCKEQIDFIAAYIIPVDVWYILPVKIAVISSSNLILSPHLPNAKHAPYKEAWHLLRGKSSKPRSPSAHPQKDADAGADAEGLSAAEAGQPRAHPDSTLAPGHVFHLVEARMLQIRDRLRTAASHKPRR